MTISVVNGEPSELSVTDASAVLFRCTTIGVRIPPVCPTNVTIPTAPSNVPLNVSVTLPVAISELLKTLANTAPFQSGPCELSSIDQNDGVFATQPWPHMMIAKSPTDVPAG